jgi:two-component system sensor histidine kinase CiaH
MFTKARMTLTAWYLLIIMCISISFSAVIYRVLSNEVDRFALNQRIRIERRIQEQVIFPNTPPQDLHGQIVLMDPDLVGETKHRILFMLIMTNSAIFFAAGIFGYMLAGKTLKPIAEMVDEQHRFISDASHELRTPLTAMKTSLEVGLRDKRLTITDAKAIITENIEQIIGLQSLSDKLLQLMQYESHHAQKEMSATDLHIPIAEAIHKLLPLAKQKHILIHQELLRASLLGNKQDLTELFVILLDNAIKYSPRESTVTIVMKRHDKTLTTDILDEGVGIAKKDIPHIFDRFYRADDARTGNSAKGYGLGLAIAKKIVEAHHGSITVESTVRKGSAFQVIFRVA